MLIFFMCMVSFVAYSSAHIEPVEGWTLTAVHKKSDALQKDKKHDRTVFGTIDASDESYESVSCWIREKQAGVYYLCVIKNGILFERNLSEDDKAWHHFPETLTNFRDFAENGGETNFHNYWKSKLEKQKCLAVKNACMAAIYSLPHKQIEPNAGGWNFVFKPSEELCKHYYGDVGGLVVWECHIGNVWLKGGQYHFDDTAWVRSCSHQQYVYVNVKGAMIVYNLSGDDNHWPEKPENLTYLKTLSQEEFKWENALEVDVFKSYVKTFIRRAVYGVDGGPLFDELLQKILSTSHQCDGWSVIPMRQDSPDLHHLPDDLTIFGTTNSKGYFEDRAVWLRKDDKRVTTLCSWYQGIFFRYNDLNADKSWTHLPQTLQYLQRLSTLMDTSGFEEAERFISNEKTMDMIRFKNGCLAAVRDSLWSPIEMAPECTLFYPRHDICAQSKGDVIISLKRCVKGYRCYGNESIWVHLCADASFLRAMIEGSLFQCRIDCANNASCWDGFPGTHAALQKVCVYGHDKCLTFAERIMLRNSCKRLICRALYKENVMEFIDGWTLEKPHALLLYEEECCQNRTILKDLMVFGKLYEGSISWRFDGQEFLCVRYKNMLLRYNLSSEGNQPDSVKGLKAASKKFFALDEKACIDIDSHLAESLAYMGERALERHFDIINAAARCYQEGVERFQHTYNLKLM